MAFPEVGVKAIIKNLQQYLDGMRKIDDANQETGTTAEKATGGLNKFGKTLLNVGKVAAVGALVGITAIGVGLFKLGQSSIEVAREFESSMADLGIAASAAGLSIDELREAAIAVGGDTRIMGASASGAAEAMTGLFKSGLTATEVFGDLNGFMEEGAELGGALRAAFDLAAATTLDVSQAADLASVALATFGSELTSEAERADFINFALNNMVQAADASVAEVNDLAEALKNVGPTASALGIPIEDVNNALALLSTRGIRGAEAGTQLKSMLTNLQRPTDAVQGALSSLNVSLFDAEGKFVGLPSLIEQLSGSLIGMNEVTTIAGGRTAAQNELLDSAQSRYEQLTKRINNHNAGLTVMSDKALAKANAELSASQQIIGELSGIHGTATTSLRQLTDEQKNAAVQTIAGTFGMNALNTLIKEQATLNDEGVNGWDAMALATADAATIQEQAAAKSATFAGAMEALEGTIETVKIQIGNELLPMITLFVKDVADFVSQHGPAMVGIFKTIVDAIAPFVDWLGFAVISGDLLNDAIARLPLPVQGVVKAFVNDFLPIIQEVVSFIENKVIPIVVDVANVWVDVFMFELKLFSSFIGNVLIPVIGEIISWIGELLPPAIQTAAQFWEDTLLPAIEDVSNFIIDEVVPVIADVVVWLEENLPIALETAAQFWEDTLLPAIEDVSNFIIDEVIPIIGDVVAWLEENIPIAIQVAAQFWEDTLLPAIETVSTFLIDEVIPVIADIVAWLEENLPIALQIAADFWEDTLLPPIENVVTFMREEIGKWIAWFEENWPLIQETAQPVIDAFIRGLKNLALVIAGIIVGIIIVWETLSPAIDNVWNIIKTIISTALGLIRSTITLVMNLINGDWEGAWETIKTAAVTVWEALKTLVSEFIEGVLNVIGSSTDEFVATWSENWEMAQNIAESVWENIKTAIKTAWDNVVAAVKDGLDDIVGAIDSLPDKLVGAGKAIVDALLKGIQDAWGNLLDVWNFLLKSLLDGLPFSEPKDPNSPLHGLSRAGEAIINNITDGVKKASPELFDALFGAAGVFTSIANGVMQFRDFLAESGQAALSIRVDTSVVEKQFKVLENQLQPLEDVTNQINALVANIDILQEERRTLLAGGPLTEGDAARVAELTQILGESSTLFLELRQIQAVEQAKISPLVRLQHESLRLALEGAQANKERNAALSRRLDLQKLLIKAGRAELLGPSTGGTFTLSEAKILEITNQLTAEQNELLEDQLLTKLEIEDATAAQAAEQAQILRLEQAQQELGFLEQQLKLLDLITEHELDPDAILGGLEFGLDANIDDIIDAMILGMEAVVDAAEDALQIASPSRPFVRMGEIIDSSLALGIMQNSRAPLSAVGLLTQSMVALPASAPSINTTTINQGASIDMNFGGNNISSDVGLLRFEGMIRRVVRQEIGGLS